MTDRFSLYPRCPCPERGLAVKPHLDGATITFLLAEKEVDGLEVLKDDRWYKVMVVPRVPFVNFVCIFLIKNNFS
ncbi:hypothetical protein RDABS01_000241 [Bienertia sinuspersici]